MRADDRRRERTVAALGDGYAAGAIDTDTLTLRVESAFRARTARELRSLTADLPRWWNALVARFAPPRVPTIHVEPPPEGPGPWTIGRSQGCRLVVADATVSRRHAVLKRTPEGIEVRDLGSLNGTWVNGWRVSRATLRPGDALQIGDVRVVLRHG
ncbi:MAG: FHA domain-containing protein [Actinomycetota bacterium]|nr:FHA domain-containing protein [Actinomycetota bacterium]